MVTDQLSIFSTGINPEAENVSVIDEDFINDDAVYVFDSTEDSVAVERYNSFLADVEANTVRHTAVPLNTVQFLGKYADPGIGNVYAKDTGENGTHLFLCGEGVNLVPVRETALNGICSRAGLSPSALKTLPLDKQEDVLNTLAKYSSAKVQMAEVYHKMNAFLSDGQGRNTYRMIPQPDLHEQMQDIADELAEGGDAVFTARWTFANAAARWKLEADPIRLNGQFYRRRFGYVTSDIGESGVHWYVDLINQNGIAIPAMDPIVSVHRKKSSDIDVMNSVSMLNANLQKGVDMLDELGRMKMHHIANAMTKAGHDVGLPKLAVLKAAAEWEKENGNSEGTALDVYLSLSAAVSDYPAGSQRAEMMRGNIRKLTGLYWPVYDRAEPYNWA